jgi:hypothetical protein
MQRKMMGLFAALVAFGAFALVPAMSSAHGLQDTVNGLTTNVALNSKIVAYNETGTETEFTGSGLTVKCSEVTMTGTVFANPHTATGAVQGTIEHVFFRGTTEDPGSSEPNTQCSSSLGGAATITVPGLTQSGGTGHWCLKTVPGTDNFNVEPRNCGGAGGEFTFIIHTNGLECKYKRTANIGGTFTTTKETHTAATLTMTNGQEFTLEAGGFLCPAIGKLNNFKFETFTDTSATTAPDYHNAASIADPVWIT